MDNALEGYYNKSVNKALKCYEKEDNIKFTLTKYESNNLETLFAAFFGIFILVIRLLPFFKLPLGLEKIVWNRFKSND